MLGSDTLNPPPEQKLNDACRKLRDYCNRMDRGLTTAEIVAALLRTLAVEIVTDIHRNNLDASRAAADYGSLLRSTITSMQDALNSKTQKRKSLAKRPTAE
jgi:hypothetical protein